LLTKDKAEFWRQITPGSTITLTDRQALADSMEKGAGVKGMDYLVQYITRIVQRESFVEWLFIRLEDPEQPIWLMVKIVDENLKLVVLFEPDEFRPGDRQDLIKREDYWLFQEPEDVHHIVYDELEFASDIPWIVAIPGSHGDETKEIIYRMKEQGVLYGMTTHLPPQTGLENVMGVVVEYITEDDEDNPELIILEIGGEHKNTGGMISVMFGVAVSPSDVEVLNLLPDRVEVVEKPSVWSKIKTIFK
jgi:hypothetical protein